MAGRFQVGTDWWGGDEVVGNGLNAGQKNFSHPHTVAQMVESIVGCKWSLLVLGAIRRGIARPGQMERAIEGISAKVLSERLDKFIRFGIVEKTAFPEVPPRVEYRLTPFGERFCRILDEVERLEAELAEESRKRS
jgi:DNA-binding HxlR family transcriptional regulator